jgi:hypothetical protein
MAEESSRLAVRPSDARPVSSALLAAERASKRGDTADVLRWVRRAAEAASEAEDDVRALELAKHAADLATQISISVIPPKPSVPAEAVLVDTGTQPSATASQTESTRPPSPDPVEAPADALAGVVARGRLPSVHEDETNPVDVAQFNAARRRSPSTEKAAAREPSRTDEIDGWATEALSAADLTAALGEVASPVTQPRGRRWATQAVRVLVWREDSGTLTVATPGTPAPANAIDAVLTALDPDSDLAALLDPR